MKSLIPALAALVLSEINPDAAEALFALAREEFRRLTGAVRY